MNTPETNKKIISTDYSIAPLPGDSDDREQPEPGAMDPKTNADLPPELQAPPLAFARKLFAGLTALMWLVIVGLMFGGGDFSSMLPIIMLMFGVLALLNIPNFWYKSKKVDAVIALGVGILCLFIAMTLFLGR